MTGNGWSVDPDRVVGVLAGIDDEGVALMRGVTAMDALAFDGAPGLTVDGRRTVAHAWQAFVDERRLVPGKLVHVLSSSARSLSEATVAVVAGDETMASDSRSAEAYALDEWGIDSTIAYSGGAY